MQSLIYSQRLSTLLHRSRVHYVITVIVGLLISATDFRFDKSWRHADSGPKAWLYVFCCTFAANYIADDRWRQIKHWRNYL